MTADAYEPFSLDADEAETAFRRKISDKHTHCIYCGRALVDVEELDKLWDRNGVRGTTVWRQCPRYPKNGLMAMLRGWCHESFKRDNPMYGREYR